MKILFTADIHIKLGQKGVPIDWAKNRYEIFMDQLWEIQESCDLFVVGGDIFDKLPSMEELEIYFDFVASCKIPTIIYSGNHEAVKKNTTFLTNLKAVTTKINSEVMIVDEFYSDEFIDIIPYNKLKEWEKDPQIFETKNKILCTHVRGEIPPHVKPEVNLELFSPWSLVLAGDLHNYNNSQRNILYPGSPVTTSFHRDLVDTGVLIVDTESLEHIWKTLAVPQLIRKTIKVGEPMVPGEYHHVVYEVEGDLGSLAILEDSDLVDKKLVKKETDTALILDAEFTIEQEIGEYLKYILGIDDLMVKEVLTEFNLHKQKISL